MKGKKKKKRLKWKPLKNGSTNTWPTLLVARLNWCSFWKMVIFFKIRISFLILIFIFILMKTIKIKKLT